MSTTLSNQPSATGDVVIVGAGLAGSLLATMLGQRGYRVRVYERRADPRLTGAERGRSINLAISTRGLTALNSVGLTDEVLARGLPMHGRMLHPVDGEQEYQSYSADGQRAINSISRGELNALLLTSAEAQPSVEVFFQHRVEHCDIDQTQLSLGTDDGEKIVTADVIIGTDGAYSAVRRAFTMRDGFNFEQDYLPYGYKELTIPAQAGEFALNPDALHIWPRGSSMMIALPNLDRSFTCTLFWPKSGDGSFAALDTSVKIADFFVEHYPDAAALMPSLVDDYTHNPVGSLVTVRCSPWWMNRCVLLGDAAHAIVPFYGQGANASFEDCLSLVAAIDAAQGDWAMAMPAYAQDRVVNSNAVADLALHNFVEMRDSVNSRRYRAVRATENTLHRLLGERYRTRYEMVSFSTTPYASIEPRVRAQRKAVAIATIATGIGLMVSGVTLAGRLRSRLARRG